MRACALRKQALAKVRHALYQLLRGGNISVSNAGALHKLHKSKGPAFASLRCPCLKDLPPIYPDYFASVLFKIKKKNVRMILSYVANYVGVRQITYVNVICNDPLYSNANYAGVWQITCVITCKTWVCKLRAYA
jgi:hypothetical protein